jgi:hypothetical protein
MEAIAHLDAALGPRDRNAGLTRWIDGHRFKARCSSFNGELRWKGIEHTNFPWTQGELMTVEGGRMPGSRKLPRAVRFVRPTDGLDTASLLVKINDDRLIMSKLRPWLWRADVR